LNQYQIKALKIKDLRMNSLNKEQLKVILYETPYKTLITLTGLSGMLYFSPTFNNRFGEILKKTLNLRKLFFGGCLFGSLLFAIHNNHNNEKLRKKYLIKTNEILT
jgi:hypothetical protein